MDKPLAVAFCRGGDDAGIPRLRLNSVVFSPHGRLLATAGNDGTGRIWGG